MTDHDGTLLDKVATGDAPLTGSVLFSLNMPDTPWFWAHVADALWMLTNPDNWLGTGSQSIDDSVTAASEVFMSFGSIVGQILPVCWATIPDTFLLCDGAHYAKLDYPALYSVLPAAFIIDADTFMVPDIQARTIIGADSLYPVGDYGGEIDHVLTVNEMPSHSHSYTGSLPILTAPPLGTGANEINPIPVQTSSAGGDQAHNNMQPYIALQYVIGAR